MKRMPYPYQRCPFHPLPELDCLRCEPIRRHQATTDWLVSKADWAAIVTLTFDPKRRGPVLLGEQRRAGKLSPSPRVTEQGLTLQDTHISIAYAERKLDEWLADSEKMLGRDLYAIGNTERQQSGGPHIHAILTAKTALREADIKRMEGLWTHRHGLAQLEVPRCQQAVVGYVSKQIDTGDSLLIWPNEKAIGSLKRRIAS